MAGETVRNQVISNILKQHSDRFRVFDNTGSEKRVVAGQFPDVILMQSEPPPNNNILFVMKIETGEDELINSVSEWKDLGSAPSVLYIVVPQSKLDEAKRLANLLNIRAKFAWYEMENDGGIGRIHYE